MYLIFLLSFLASLLGHTNAQCQSYGLDFVDGGSYFIDNTLSTNFTFLSEFDGCSTDTVVPILVDPDENEYFCSEIPTTPDLTSFLSTCPILQTEMFDGTWYIVIEGLTFAYVRTFTITVGTPTTITATSTVTIGVTSVPNAVTSTFTSTSSGSTSLLPSTTTVPCKTLSFTSTIYPSPVFSTITRTVTFTSTTKTTSLSKTSTITSTAICTPAPYPRGPDPKLQVPWVLPHTTIEPASKGKARNRDVAWQARDLAFLRAANQGLARRGPDAATVTVTETTFTAMTTTTTTLEPSTVTQTTFTTTIITITPTPVTRCSGVTKITLTTTAPTKTYTRLTVTHTTIYVTKTIPIGLTMHAWTTPAAFATSCINSGGSI